MTPAGVVMQATVTVAQLVQLAGCDTLDRCDAVARSAGLAPFTLGPWTPAALGRATAATTPARTRLGAVEIDLVLSVEGEPAASTVRVTGATARPPAGADPGAWASALAGELARALGAAAARRTPDGDSVETFAAGAFQAELARGPRQGGPRLDVRRRPVFRR